LHAHVADIELAIQTTEMPLPKQHLFDTLSAVAGQGADEQRAAHPLRWSWNGGVPATLWSCGSSIGWPLAAPPGRYGNRAG
jgi:hypothetical protein